MPARKCLFIQGAGGIPSYSGADLRNMIGNILGDGSFSTPVAGVGAIGRGHGALSFGAMRVTANTPADNSVTVAAGNVVVRGTQSEEQGSYLCPLKSPAALTIPPRDLVDARTDYIVAQVRDNEYATLQGDTWALEVVAGTPGAGAPAVPQDCLVLASVNVAPGTDPLVVEQAHVLDLRPQARAQGGITPAGSLTAFPDPQDGDVVWNYNETRLYARSADTWIEIGADLDAEWINYTPSLSGISLGNGTRWGRYAMLDKTVIVAAGFDLGTTGDVTATSNLSIGLPFNARSYGSNIDVPCSAHARIGTKEYSAMGAIYPWYIPNLMTNFSTRNRPAWSRYVPVDWAAQGAPRGRMNVFCIYEKV